MTYPLAEHLARQVLLDDQHAVDDAIADWVIAYRARVGAEPSEAEHAVARRVIEGRMLDEVPPLPSSGCSGTWSRTTLERGIPGGRE